MNERIKQLRKALGMTQQSFADKIGIKRSTIAVYETGRNEPIDSIIISICREFNVNEDWLRTGQGNMFNDTDTMTLIDYWMTGENDTAKEVFKRFARLDEEAWEHLRIVIDKLKENDS